MFSSHLTKCHACHGICTLSPFDAALTMRFAKNTLHDTSTALRLPRKMTIDTSKVQSAAPATKTATHLRKTSQKYCACHTKRLSTRYKTRLNVTKCHACHAKRSNEMFETYKTTTSAELTIGTAIWGSRGRLRTVANGCGGLRTVADGCGRLRMVATVNATSSEQTLNPRPPEWNGNPCYAFGKRPVTPNSLHI